MQNKICKKGRVVEFEYLSGEKPCVGWGDVDFDKISNLHFIVYCHAETD